jgi:hypothetical protein
MEMNKNQEQSCNQRYSSSWLLRREAGEGRRPEGPDEELLGAIAVRECLLDQIVEAGGHHAPAHLKKALKNQERAVARLKREKGLGEPEPLFDEDM